MRKIKTSVFLGLASMVLASVACERDTAVIDTVNDSDKGPVPYFLDVPSQFPEPDIPVDNPLTVEGVALGRSLFYDPILSLNDGQSCGSCHNQSFGFTDNGNRTSVGVEGIFGDRNSMAIMNLAWDRHFFWDGRSFSLEHQALEPVPNPIEMNISWPDALQKLNSHPEYPQRFKEAFGTEVIDSNMVTNAIAQFERTLISSESKYDKYRRGEVQLSPLERQGEGLFFSEKADCFHCHNWPIFNSGDFHNNGLQQPIIDRGRAEVTGNPADAGKFKAPSLRNIAVTGPYMHDGRFNTLEEVVEFYNSGVNQNSPTVDPVMVKSNRVNGSLGLTAQDKQALVAFLRTLTDSTYLNNPDFSNPNN